MYLQCPTHDGTAEPLGYNAAAGYEIWQSRTGHIEPFMVELYSVEAEPPKGNRLRRLALANLATALILLIIWLLFLQG